jgi:hypothetical protein
MIAKFNCDEHSTVASKFNIFDITINNEFTDVGSSISLSSLTLILLML